MTGKFTEEFWNKFTDVLEDKAAVDKDKLTTEATIGSLSLDSLDKVELVMGLEEEFPGLDIPDEVAATYTDDKTLAEMAQDVYERLAA